MQTQLTHFFIEQQIAYPNFCAIFTILLLLLFVACILYLVVQFAIVRPLEKKVGTKNKSTFFSNLVHYKVIRYLTLTLQALVIFLLAQLWFEQDEFILTLIQIGINIVCLLFGLLAFFSFLNLIEATLSQYDSLKHFPTRGFSQGIKIILAIFILITIISILVGKSPGLILSGLGAMTAILMLVFKDPILGFVAGIQLSANKSLAIGDWIQLDNYHANGFVIEISIITVKVKNWDNTMVSIPTYALISEGFTSWENMLKSGGRKIQRSVNIDLTSISFLTETQLSQFASIHLLQSTIDHLQKNFNPLEQPTNIGLFKAYLEVYLKNHPKINLNMPCVVRQLAPSDAGLPIELFTYTNTTIWVEYEAIQAQIMEHMIAMLPEFGLRIFQKPSGYDLGVLKSI